MTSFVRIIVILAALPFSGSCTYVTGSLPPCPSVIRAPSMLTFQISGASYYDRWSRANVRHSVYVKLTEPDGISLWRYKPNLRQVKCVRKPEPRLERWLSSAEILLREPRAFELLDPIDEPEGEVLVLGHAQIRTAVEVEELTNEGLAAARNLSCLAVEAFGNPVERAVQAISPVFAARTGFPESCPGSRKSHRTALVYLCCKDIALNTEGDGRLSD